jgi:hypothetical protein
MKKRIKCKAYFVDSEQVRYGFYGLPGQAHRRIKHGVEFVFEFDDEKHDVKEVDGRRMLAYKKEKGKFRLSEWIQVVNMSKQPKPDDFPEVVAD